MATLTIGNVNCNNFPSLHRIAGDAGYSGMVKLVDECTYRIELCFLYADERAQVERMIGRYALLGFAVSVDS